MKLNALGLADKQRDEYNSGQWDGDDPQSCEAAGGILSYSYFRFDEYGRGVPPVRFFCRMPVTSGNNGSGAPITVTVPTTVQTNVSPQISPTFVQQSEPSNSPIGADVRYMTDAGQSSSQDVSPTPTSPGMTLAPSPANLDPNAAPAIIEGGLSGDNGMGKILLIAAAIFGAITLSRNDKRKGN